MLTLSAVTGFEYDGSRVKLSSVPTEGDAHYWLKENDLLITRSNTRALVGHVAIYDGTPRRAICCDLIMKMQVDQSKASTRFVYYYLRSPEARSYLMDRAQGANPTMVKIGKQVVQNLPVPLPSLSEQHRIVRILDKAFDGIATAKANAEKNLENARALFQSGYISLFDEVVREDYQVATVAEVAFPSKGSIRTGPFGSQLLHGEFVDDGVAVLGIDNAVNNEFRWDQRRYITEEKYRELSRYLVKPGDVLITIMGTCGRCAIVPDDIQTAVTTKHLCCITLDKRKCLPRFLHGYFLYHPVAQQFLAARAKGSIMAGLNMGIISELPILLPNLKQQQSVVERVEFLHEEAQRLAAIYQQKLNALNELETSLLHQAFIGQL